MMPTPASTCLASLLSTPAMDAEEFRRAEVWLRAAVQAMDPATSIADVMRFIVEGRRIHGCDVREMESLAALVPALSPSMTDSEAIGLLRDCRESIRRARRER